RFEKKFSLVGENITESTESDLIEVKKNHTILREEKKRRQAFTSKTFAEMRGFYLRSDSEGNEGTETRSKLHPITQHGPLSQSRPHARRMDSISRKKSRVVGEDEVEDEDQQEVVEKVNEEELTSNSLSWRETVQRVRAGQMSLKELEKQLKIRARVALSLSFSFQLLSLLFSSSSLVRSISLMSLHALSLIFYTELACVCMCVFSSLRRSPFI
ncbi:hypothetical protein AAMO2058_001623600, partial [Amorphochlora amoebiformis]